MGRAVRLPARRPAIGLEAAVAAPLGLIVGIGAVMRVAAGGPPTTYAATAPWAAVLTLTAGLGLLTAGLVPVLLTRPGPQRSPTRRSLGRLTAALGLAWLAPLWVGWWDGPELIRSLATLAVPLLIPLLIHLMILVAGRPADSGPARTLVWIGYATTLSLVVVRALFHDPIRDLDCWANCTVNSLLITPVPALVRTTTTLWVWLILCLAVLAIASSVRALMRVTAVRRARIAPLLGPASLAMLAECVRVVILRLDPPEDPTQLPFAIVFAVRASTLTALAGGLLWAQWRELDRHRAMARLVDALELEPGSGAVRSALSSTLTDPGLEVAYWAPGVGHYVDAAGQPFPFPDEGADATVTSVERGGLPMVAIVHRRPPPEDWDAEATLGPAARLAMDNERLRAELLAQLDALRHSRARIVTTADEFRARIERDLHDGTQQSLISLLFELRLATNGAREAGETGRVEQLSAAVTEVERAIAELRDLAHGIFPAVLDEAGLATALQSLADLAPVPLELATLPSRRLPTVAERTAYAIIKGVLEHAGRDGSPGLTVRADDEQDHLSISVHGAPAQDYLHLADRVGAIGGDLTCTDGMLRAQVPCG